MIDRHSAAPRYALPLAFLIALLAIVLVPLSATAQVPEPPTDLYASAYNATDNEVELRWTPPASGPAPTGYVLEGGLTPGQALVSFATGSTLPGDSVTLPGVAFYVRVYSVSGSSRSIASNEIHVLLGQPVAPSAPTNLLATVDGSSVTLAWRNTFDGGIPESVLVDVVGLGAIPLALTEVAGFTGVPGGTYTLSVRASNRSGASGGSNPLTLTIPGPCSGVPEAPADFAAFREDSTLSAIWESPSTGPAPARYTVVVTGSFNVQIQTADRELSGTVPPGTYNISVRGENSCGASAPTAVQSVVVP